MNKIGIFGGTFNPPHIGHLEVVNAVKNAYNLECVFWIPNNIPNLKTIDFSRFNQCDNLKQFLENNNCHDEVLDIDIKRGGITYSIDTVKELTQIYPKSELYFIIGSDILLSITKWKDIYQLVKMVKFICVTRVGYEINELLKKIPLEIRENIEILEAEIPDISSTNLRKSKTFNSE